MISKLEENFKSHVNENLKASEIKYLQKMQIGYYINKRQYTIQRVTCHIVRIGNLEY
ncbi:unnamed protein product [Paramecium sonneborni]|uniref:Uncharacterized protein n=1 Tax=Paramecium sonneborni TaxID=65129 RepID=A0A8S1QVI1_9CILI|nr:unnamed protein product [Paramecium sonneborni]